MPIDDAYAADIRKLNYEALVLCREMVRRDKADACLRLGLSEASADALELTTLADLQHCADVGVLLFQPRFRDTHFWECAIESARTDGGRKLNAACLRAMLMAAQRPR